MWGEENRPPAPVAGFGDDALQQHVDESAQPDETLEPPDAREPEPTAERQPAPVYDLIRYDVNDQRIAELRDEFAPLAERTPENYEPRRKAIAVLRGLRVAVDKKRKSLNEDAVRWHRKVQSTAKHYREALEAIEEPLQLAKDADDQDKARVKAEKEAAEKAVIEAELRAQREAEEARLKAEREAEEARLLAERQAEEARLVEERKALEVERTRLAEERRQADEAARVERERVEAEQKAERERLDAEGAKLRAEREAQAEAARVEQQKLAEERRQLAEDRERAEREELARRTRIQVEEDAKAQAERDRIAAEEAKVAELERHAAHAKRIEALKPDAEKVAAFAKSIRLAVGGLYTPEVTSAAAVNAIGFAMGELARVADELEANFKREAGMS